MRFGIGRNGLCLALLLWVAPAAAQSNQPPHYNPCKLQEFTYGGADARFLSSVTPGIPLQAWAELLNQHWAQTQMTDSLLDAGAVRAGLSAIGLSAEVPEFELGEYQREFESEHYQPAASDDPQKAAYEKAAILYRGANWNAAISLFDTVANDKTSSYRAAAAYTAARAAFNAGNFNDGLTRLAALAADPALQEFHGPAYRLIGTLAYDTGDDAFMAAHYIEMKHLLLMPPLRACHDAVAQDALGAAADDLSWYLGRAFGIRHEASTAKRGLLDRLAIVDPFFDVMRAVEAPSPYQSDRGWLNAFIVDPQRDIRNLPSKDADAITAHAREQWLKTKDPLWGYALAQRSADPKDVDLIRDMIAGLTSLPKTEALACAAPIFRRFFIRHAVRILLMDGKLDAALELLHANWLEDDNDRMENNYAAYPHSGWRLHGAYRGTHFDNAGAMLNGGIRLFLEKFDLPSARRWAAEAGTIFNDTAIDQELRPLLAQNFDEFLAGTVPGDGRDRYAPQSDAAHYSIPRTVTDFYSTRKILTLAGTAAVTKTDRRAMLAAAWLRSWVLNDGNLTYGLLPQLRDAYPELAADIDGIRDAWLQSTKQHLLTRLVARVPGFSLRPSWVHATLPQETASAHPGGFYGGYGRDGETIFAIDSGNPSDGNWWCPVDLDELKLDMVREFYERPLGGGTDVFDDPVAMTDRWYYAPEPDDVKKRRLALADKVIAWHPLLKDADFGELKRLSEVENGPRLLSEQAIAWAQGGNWLTRLFRLDNHLPETLHLAVRSTRYGCREQGGHGAYSREAWKLLHKQYPQSDWAAKTPFWFNQLQ